MHGTADERHGRRRPGRRHQPAPTADAVVEPLTGAAPLVVHATANASDPDGDVVAVSWDSGAGGARVLHRPRDARVHQPRDVRRPAARERRARAACTSRSSRSPSPASRSARPRAADRRRAPGDRRAGRAGARDRAARGRLLDAGHHPRHRPLLLRRPRGLPRPDRRGRHGPPSRPDLHLARRHRRRSRAPPHAGARARAALRRPARRRALPLRHHPALRRGQRDLAALHLRRVGRERAWSRSSSRCAPARRPSPLVVHDPDNAARRIGCADLTPGTADLAYSWSFGDGTTGTGADPDHTYAAPGTYTATVTVTHGSGAHAGHGSVSDSVQVVVDGRARAASRPRRAPAAPPAVVPTGPRPGSPGSGRGARPPTPDRPRPGCATRDSRSGRARSCCASTAAAPLR